MVTLEFVAPDALAHMEAPPSLAPVIVLLNVVSAVGAAVLFGMADKFAVTERSPRPVVETGACLLLNAIGLICSFVIAIAAAFASVSFD